MHLLAIVMWSGKYSEYLYATADDRGKMYDELLAALALAIIIGNTSPDVPRKPKAAADDLPLDELHTLTMA